MRYWLTCALLAAAPLLAYADNPAPSSEAAPPTIEVITETEWEFYRNGELGIQMRLPSRWQVDEEARSLLAQAPDEDVKLFVTGTVDPEEAEELDRQVRRIFEQVSYHQDRISFDRDGMTIWAETATAEREGRTYGLIVYSILLPYDSYTVAMLWCDLDVIIEYESVLRMVLRGIRPLPHSSPGSDLFE